MILCLTPNPAIDRTLLVPSLVLGNVHRAMETIVAAGGKGLNVARAIRRLGGDSFCMGFAGGHSGRLLADLAQQEGQAASWTWTDTETRTCTIVISQDGVVTEVDEPGLPVSPADWEQLSQDLETHFLSTHLTCISGSLPPGSSAEDLQALLDLLTKAGKSVWVDTSGKTLDALLEVSGICLKVNGNEIGKSLGFEIADLSSAQRALDRLEKSGPRVRCITLGAEGAVLGAVNQRWYARGPQIRAVSPVGSGDSFLGGLLYALDQNQSWPEALRDAVAAGTANTLSPGGARFTFQEFENFRGQVEIQTL